MSLHLSQHIFESGPLFLQHIRRGSVAACVVVTDVKRFQKLSERSSETRPPLMNDFMGEAEEIHVTLEMCDHLLGTPEVFETAIAILQEEDVETSIDTDVEGDDFVR